MESLAGVMRGLKLLRICKAWSRLFITRSFSYIYGAVAGFGVLVPERHAQQ